MNQRDIFLLFIENKNYFHEILCQRYFVNLCFNRMCNDRDFYIQKKLNKLVIMQTIHFTIKISQK